MLNLNIEINNESIMSGHTKTSYVVWVLYMVLTDSSRTMDYPGPCLNPWSTTTSGLESHNLKLKETSGVLYLYPPFFPQTILICLENNNAALTRSYPLSRLSRITASHLDTGYCGIPACLTLGCIGSQARYFRGQLSSLLSMIDCRHNSVRYTKNTKTKRRKARIAYYSKSIVTYQLLMACGDVHPQPEPALTKAFDAVCFKTMITRLYHLCFQRVFLNG